MLNTKSTSLHNTITYLSNNVKSNRSLFIQKLIGIFMIAFSIFMILILPDDTAMILFVLLGIGLVTSKKIYLEFLEQTEVDEEG